MDIGVQPQSSFSTLDAALSLLLSVHFLMFGEMCLEHSKVARNLKGTLPTHTSALSAKRRSCVFTLAGGPRSSSSRGGGRRSSMSLIRVALENIT